MPWWKFWERPAQAETTAKPWFDPDRAGTPVMFEDDPNFFWVTNGHLSGRGRGDAIPAAHAAINTLTAQMGLLQPTVARDNMPVEAHRIKTLLRYPNRTIDPHLFWMMLYRPYHSHGNSYAYIRRDFQGRPVELVPATVLDARFVESRRAPYVAYRIELLGADIRGGMALERQINTTSRDLITLHGMGFDGLKSPSPVQYAAKVQIETMKAIGDHERAVMRDGLNSGTVVTIDSDALNLSTPGAWEELVKRVQSGMKASRKEGSAVPLLPPGVKLERLNSISNVDMQLIDLLRWGVEDIARVWRISPARLGHFYEGMRVAGMEAQFTDFERFTLADHVQAVEEQLTRKLLTAEEIMAGLEITVPTDSLKRGSLSERAKVAKETVADGGLMTINEGRELMGLPPHPDGDRLLQPKGAPAQNDGGSNEPDDD